MVKNLCGKGFRRNFQFHCTPAVAEGHQAIDPETKLAILQLPLWPQVVFIDCPLSCARVRVELDHQNLFLFADGQPAFISIVDKGSALNSTQIMRCYIGAHQGGKRYPKLCKKLFVPWPVIHWSFSDSLACHLSISPRTMSIEPITATTSAINRPAHMVWSACNVANEGFRMCTR